MTDHDRDTEWAERAGRLQFFVEELVALARLDAPAGFVADRVAQLAAQAERHVDELRLDEGAISRRTTELRLSADMYKARQRRGPRDV